MRSLWSKQRVQYCLATTLLFAIVPQSGWGQLPKAATASNDPEQVQKPEIPEDPLGRTTPRGTVLGFFSAAYNQKYDVAAQYLDTRAHGQSAAILAKQLFFVLDRKLPAKLNNVSNDPLGSLTDPLNSRRELIGTIVTDKGGDVDIYLERVDRHNGPIWLFSRQTLIDISDVYHEINETTVETIVPDFLLKKYFRVTIFGWTYFLVFLPLLYLALTLINRVASAGAGYAIRRWTPRKMARNPTILPHPLRLLIIAYTIFTTLHEISLSLVTRQVGSTIAVLILIAAFVWAMFMVNAACEVYFRKRLQKSGRLSATVVLRPFRRMMDLIAIIVGLIWLLYTVGVNPTAALAGLGVGGIAIALSVQKTLENVIGGASLIMGGEVHVGDCIKIGDVVGTIEGVGLRSTRVRTFDRTVVTIPNGQMAVMTLENLSARDQFWLRHLIGVEYETAPDALNSILVEARRLLDSDPRVLPLSARVRFLRFAESSLELEVFAYISATDWNHFLEIQEDLLIKIRQLAASAGANFAYPSRTIHLKNQVESGEAPLQPTLQFGVAEKEVGV
ncbi:MAG TPA: mechanosensitive ion channel family protein [Acidobacteriaceae bacterium]|nr:mechanosensitive ion channel family protein [Acidobacteriaceae bacterium]